VSEFLYTSNTTYGEYTNYTGEGDANATLAESNNRTASVASYVITRCPANEYNNGGSLATACMACPNGTATRFDPSPWYGYYSMYYSNGMSSGNTQDMCGESIRLCV
jgi:hypothetical protein